ncbi:membrane-bound lytic murein transglycosylase D [Siphonobacter aquaeclarae]|uniref:Membrane-bound lytic murein transglycosylase D n=2 Tax=Siphonobacter aquaeclarae TaxID=563176 RepID=A0A1G9NAA4_9BACT|nr:membrane-bound lytic murein transglycosylase D [Siphonobacter aquaeclarae]
MMKQIRILTVALATATLSICSAGAQTDSTKTVASPQDTIPHVDFQVVHDRMAKLEKEIPLTHNDVTHQFVEFFAVRKPSFVKTMLERKALYFPIFEKYLAQYGLPDELKYLSLIESRLEPTIISYAGAGGLWQFMPSTARIDFKLRVDKYVDERFDPYKATEAACKYFLQLGRIFNYDWEMMLASYNTGPGNALRAMRRSGGKKGYWNVYPYLHKQTRGYVPQYAAIVYMMHYADDHGIRPDSVQRQASFDTIHVNSYLNLKTLAVAGQIPYDKIRQLNPHILTDVLPNDTRQFPLRLPKNDLKYFYAHRQTVIDSAIRLPYDDKVMLAASETRDDGDFGDEEEEPVRTTSKKFLHRVRRGESLVSIAHKYDIDGRNLKIWNRLGRRAKIHPGQKLVVYKLVEVPASSAQVAKVSNSPRSERLSKARKYHTVQRGDTLWKISQRYGGISIDKIKKINGIKGNEVRPGQKLLII